ncbi:DUF4435 domain-containing protein [Pseudomonas sp. V88_4]|uniref:DUF4435 domain-containing protein n=1 Tax=Pseudomonas sp. V88_4 TaxID=3044229 RepID=UPI00249F1B92|nr:DUF4435 domain-containing protein [Pseudomonas sp. V88_4]MDI3399418.1 DUF4435 domain-containing protein [Pseudomonas sp. V88_4]
MSSYSSVSSYLLAVRLRTNKTLLVEGVSDKKVLSHFILKKNHKDNVLANYCIDDASLVDDKTLGVIGAREKIKNIASRQPSGNFRCLIDREWDGLNTVNFEYEPTLFPENTFVTRGHSIENYWFTPSSFIDFIIYTHHAAVTEQYLRKIESHYVSILQFSAAYSLACRSLSVVTRANEMLSYENVTLENSIFTASAGVDNKILARGQHCNMFETINSFLATTQQFDQNRLQWICHGHLGEQAIRACIARLAQIEGYDAATIESIEYGFKIEKLKLDSEHVASLPEGVATPLNQVLHWIRHMEE